jgi:hypothetical protein
MKLASNLRVDGRTFASPWIPTLVPWYPCLQIISAQIECLPDTTHKESGLPLSHAMSDEFM